jgi:SAM-dependent methyltransferase
MSPQMSIELENISGGLTLGEDGIWLSKTDTRVSYPEDGHARLAQLEDDSFWFAHRNRCIEAMIGKHPPQGSNTLFDVGGGNGCVAHYLQQSRYNVVLVEPGVEGIRAARSRGLKNLVNATLQDAQFNEGSLPAVGMFDVIEHIEDDGGTLASIKKLLRPGGMLYLPVPTYSWLWSQKDIEAGHYRRYTRDSITEVLEASGFRVEFASFYFDH